MISFPSKVLALAIVMASTAAAAPASAPVYPRVIVDPAQPGNGTLPIMIPAPSSGNYSVAVETRRLTDYSRLDLFSHNKTYRSIMTTAFYPLQEQQQQCTYPYVDAPKTLKYMNGDYSDFKWNFDHVQLGVCNGSLSSTGSVLPSAPVLVLSPALSTYRFIYGAMAQSLAARGYIVVTIDHPYDAEFMEYPDGKVVEGIDLDDDNPSPTSGFTYGQDVAVRAQDVVFLLDQLQAGAFRLGRSLSSSSSSPPSNSNSTSTNPAYSISVDRVVAAGHSAGGATAMSAMLLDDRIIGAMNLDGEFEGPIRTEGLTKPLLIISSNGTDPNTRNLTNHAWPLLTGWKRQLMLLKSQHDTLSDDSLLGTLLGRNKAVNGTEGPLDGVRVRNILQTYMGAFADMVYAAPDLKAGDEPSGLLAGPSAAYPEMAFIR